MAGGRGLLAGRPCRPPFPLARRSGDSETCAVAGQLGGGASPSAIVHQLGRRQLPETLAAALGGACPCQWPHLCVWGCLCLGLPVRRSVHKVARRPSSPLGAARRPLIMASEVAP